MTAEDVGRIIGRSRSRAVKMYYDIGITSQRGGDNVKEIRWLGKDRIAEIHLKDGKAYLDGGKIDMQAVMKAIAGISGSVDADMRRNLEYVRCGPPKSMQTRRAYVAHAPTRAASTIVSTLRRVLTASSTEWLTATLVAAGRSGSGR